MDRELSAAAASVEKMALQVRDLKRVIGCLVVAAKGNIFVSRSLSQRAPDIDLLVERDYARDGVNYNAFMKPEFPRPMNKKTVDTD